jgi:hypothetical protein
MASRVDLAKQVLHTGNIQLINSDARTSVLDCANGKPSPVAATGGSAQLSSDLLSVMLTCAQHHTIGIGYITNGTHSSGSAHYDGRAMDIDTIDGSATSGRDPHALALIKDICGNIPGGTSIGQSGCGPDPGCNSITQFSDTCNHLHVQVANNTGSSTGAPGDTTGAGATGGDAGSFSESDLFAIGRASAFSTQMQLPGLMNTAESIMMKGAKSVFNDQALMEFVQQLCQASLRQFQSLPNGAFFAFFPDQFGLYGHRKPYWAIDDIEIVDGKMDMTDESLVTHLFVVGDTNFSQDQGIDIGDMVNSKGVVTIFDYFGSSLIVEEEPKNQRQKDEKQLAAFRNAVDFLRKYGQRPLYQEAPFIRNSFFEIFYAYTQFEMLWANQFRTTFSFTFMPELFPGGRVAFPDHHIQCYIDNVTHTFDYENGFTTQANLSAPSATDDSRVTQGMLAPFTKEFQPFLQIDPGKQKDKSGGKGD